MAVVRSSSVAVALRLTVSIRAAAHAEGERPRAATHDVGRRGRNRLRRLIRDLVRLRQLRDLDGVASLNGRRRPGRCEHARVADRQAGAVEVGRSEWHRPHFAGRSTSCSAWRNRSTSS